MSMKKPSFIRLKMLKKNILSTRRSSIIRKVIGHTDVLFLNINCNYLKVSAGVLKPCRLSSFKNVSDVKALWQYKCIALI